MFKKAREVKCVDCYYYKKDKTKVRYEQCVNCPYKYKSGK